MTYDYLVIVASDARSSYTFFYVYVPGCTNVRIFALASSVETSKNHHALTNLLTY